jgi:tetratricopeptide (TPR) repeat protein
MPDIQNENSTVAGQPRFRLHLTQEPITLIVLAVLAVVLFAWVGGLSRLYHAQRAALGDRWFARGVEDLKAHKYDPAVTEFHAALLYDRDDYAYQLNLAEALIGVGRTAEADSYLVNLWDREPENGVVNLELARIAAHTSDTQAAERYYHDAIYATWPNDEETKRRDARLELIEFLLDTLPSNKGARAQAESELIALEENAGEDPELQERIGYLFTRTLDYERALNAYRVGLRSERHNATIEARAGDAAFQLARYPQARRYLQVAVAANPADAQSAELLKTTEMVLEMDPFRRQISVRERDRIVVEAFQTAGERLNHCNLQKTAGAQTNLVQRWAGLKPQITEANLRRDPDLVEAAMEVVFNIERQTSTSCGAPTGPDLALQLIAGLHEGS